MIRNFHVAELDQKPHWHMQLQLNLLSVLARLDISISAAPLADKRTITWCDVKRMHEQKGEDVVKTEVERFGHSLRVQDVKVQYSTIKMVVMERANDLTLVSRNPIKALNRLIPNKMKKKKKQQQQQNPCRRFGPYHRKLSIRSRLLTLLFMTNWVVKNLYESYARRNVATYIFVGMVECTIVRLIVIALCCKFFCRGARTNVCETTVCAEGLLSSILFGNSPGQLQLLPNNCRFTI